MSEQTAQEIRARHRENFDELNRRTAATAHGRHVRFFNFGYAPLEGEATRGPTLPRLFPKPDSAQLLLQVVGDADLTDGLVMEIGCGRGGNLWFLRRYCGVGSTVGLDLSETALQFAARDGEDTGAQVQGDAERLPFAGAVAGAVLSIETSAAYPDVERFFREVARVVRPGGLFLYADALPCGLVPAYSRVLRDVGFTPLEERDITANVVAARAARGPREDELLGDDGRDPLGEWVGRPGSRIHATLADGSSQYRLWRLERGPGVASAAPLFRADERTEQRRWAARSAEMLTLAPDRPEDPSAPSGAVADATPVPPGRR